MNYLLEFGAEVVSPAGAGFIQKKMLIDFMQHKDGLPPRWGGITHISQKIGSEEPIF